MYIKKAVVLAAGKSSRFGQNKLTVKVAGKTLPQHIMDFCISNGIGEVCITISKSDFYLQGGTKVCHPIISALKGFYSNMLDIRYVFQPDDEYGPGAAIKAWKDSVKEPFLVLFGDNFYRGRLKEFDMEKNDCVVSYQRRQAHPRNLQLAAISQNIVIQKPHQVVSGNFFCGYAAFNPIIFDNIDRIRKSGRNELEITDMINFCEKRSFRNLELSWGDITYQGDVQKLEDYIGRIV